MFIRRSQTEERQYQEGRRDGFSGTFNKQDMHKYPAYGAGVRAGIVESLGMLGIDAVDPSTEEEWRAGKPPHTKVKDDRTGPK